MDRGSEEAWAKRVESWKESGLTAGEFASEVGINPRSLTWWRWRLGTGDKKRTRARRSRPTTKSTTATKGRSMSTVSPLTFLEMPAELRGDALEVVLATSVRIRVPRAFDAATLIRLLDVLEQRR